MTMKQQKGFTLIEISIALVIIGLMAAGILIGSDLVRAAQIRMQIAQIEQYDTAVNTFRSKYNCLPGDCGNALEFGLGVAGGDGDNGDGDGIYEVLDNDLIEQQNLWIHLSNAGLISGTFTDGTVPGINSPPLKFTAIGAGIDPAINNNKGGVWLIHNRQFIVDAFYTEVANNLNPAWLLAIRAVNGMGPGGVYRPLDTFAIDSKIDDGFPLNGIVISVSGFGTGGGTTTEYCNSSESTCIAKYSMGVDSEEDACVIVNPSGDSSDPAVYNLIPSTTLNYGLCLPAIKAKF